VRDGSLASLTVEYDNPIDPRTELKNGMYLDVNGLPCRICDFTPCRAGKGGYRKAYITAVEVSTGRKLQTWLRGSVKPALLARQEYVVVEIDDDGFMTLLSSAGECRSDIRLTRWDVQYPAGAAATLANQIEQGLENDAQVTVIIASWAAHGLEFVESATCALPAVNGSDASVLPVVEGVIPVAPAACSEEEAADAVLCSDDTHTDVEQVDAPERAPELDDWVLVESL